MRLPLRGLAAGPGDETTPAISPAAAAVREEDRRILRRTRLRLMAVSGAITLVILAVLGVAVYGVTASILTANSTDRLRHVAEDITTPGSSRPTEYELSFGGERAGILAVIIDTTGTPQWGPRLLPDGLPDGKGVAAALAGTTDIRTIDLASGISCRVYTTPIYATDGTVAGVIQTAADTTEEVHLLGTLLLVLLLGGAVALLAALLAGYLYAGRALVPIRASMNRREAALQRQREFAANASHELRTPLTIIGASVEDLKRNRRSKVEDVGEALDDIEAEVRHMAALVEDMLLLARSDSGVVVVDRVPLDLSDVAVDAASALVSVGQERGVGVVLDPLPAQVGGDPLRLRQLVTILVDNAIRHSPHGSTVEVRVRPEAGWAALTVSDHGPGIRLEDLQRIFERFWRADDAPAGGTGLGLSIAHWIVTQHGGTIEASNRPEGGASFLVRLPLVAPGSPEVDAPSDEIGPAPDDDAADPGARLG